MKSPNIAKGKCDSAKNSAWIGFQGKIRKFYKNLGNRQLRHKGKQYLNSEDPDSLLIEAVRPGRWN